MFIKAQPHVPIMLLFPAIKQTQLRSPAEAVGRTLLLDSIFARCHHACARA